MPIGLRRLSPPRSDSVFRARSAAVLSRCRRISSRAVPGDRERDYLHFVGIAIGSASEVRYLVGLAVRLGFANEPDGQRLKVGYSRVIRALQALVTSLSSPEARSPRPEAP